MIDINKEYRTRDGRPVKLAGINEDAKNMSVLGWAKNKGKWVSYSWCINGRLWHDGSKSHNDLIEVQKPQPGEVWETNDGECSERCFIIEGPFSSVYVTWANGNVCYIGHYDTTQWTKVYPND